MGIDSTTPRTRRALLAGGLAAAVAGTLGRAQPASAHDPDDVRLGAANSTTGITTITNTSTFGIAVDGVATGPATGVAGSSDSGIGVHGHSGSGLGVFGDTTSGFGVYGSSGSGPGLFGGSHSGAGVRGDSDLSNGVYGRTLSDTASGVYGEALNAGGHGVAGRSNAGPLVNGFGAAAALGDNTADGIGVWARSAHGIALYAEAVSPDATAVSAKGVAKFSRSGKLTVKAGTSSVSKTGIRIDAGTLVLATLQQDRPGVYVRSAVPNAAGDSLTIRLNKSVASDTRVGWFLVN
jgi:hypothetical protein